MPSINGFSVSSRPSAIGVRNVLVPGTSVRLPVRGEVAPLLIGLAKEFNEKVERLRPGWNWGYAYRAVRGLSKPSFHAAGVAIDLNAPRHPLGKRNTFTPAQRAMCRALAKKYGCRWGGDYRLRKDEMHFEVILPRAQALALVRRLQSPARPRPPARPTPPPVLREGMMDNAHVRVVQRHLTKAKTYTGRIDGDFGPGTKRAVVAVQKRHGLGADGVVGPATWKLLQTRYA
jgi:hypothetical protein